MFFTDMLVCMACTYGAIIIASKIYFKNALKTYWLLFFVFCAISFFLSAFAHKMLHSKSIYFSNISWICAIIGVMCFTLGVLSVNKQLKKIYIFLLWIYAVINVTLVVIGTDFIWIIIYCLINMYLIILFNKQIKLISFHHWYSKGILLGTGLYLLSAFAFVVFRNIDIIDVRLISHVLIALGVVLFSASCEKTIIVWEYAKPDMQKTPLQKIDF